MCLPVVEAIWKRPRVFRDFLVASNFTFTSSRYPSVVRRSSRFWSCPSLDGSKCSSETWTSWKLHNTKLLKGRKVNKNCTKMRADMTIMSKEHVPFCSHQKWISKINEYQTVPATLDHHRLPKLLHRSAVLEQSPHVAEDFPNAQKSSSVSQRMQSIATDGPNQFDVSLRASSKIEETSSSIGNKYIHKRNYIWDRSSIWYISVHLSELLRFSLIWLLIWLHLRAMLKLPKFCTFREFICIIIAFRASALDFTAVCTSATNLESSMELQISGGQWRW